MSESQRTADEQPVNKVCAMGSVGVAVALFFVTTFLAALVIYIICACLGGKAQLIHFVDKVPDFPAWINWPLKGVAIFWLTTKLYPACMKARLKRRLARG